MQKCANESCNSILTEFDMQFHKNLYGRKDTKDCKCFHCISGFSRGALERKTIITDTPGFLFRLIPVLFLTFGVCLRLEFHVIFLAYYYLCFVLGFACSLLFRRRGIDIFGNPSTEGFSYTKSGEYTSTINSDGSVTTREATGFVNGTKPNPILWTLFFFAFCPLQFIGFLIKPIAKTSKAKNGFRKANPPEIIRAYRTTQRQCAPVLTITSHEERTYCKREDKYFQKITKIKKQYAFAGEEEIQRRIDALPLPYAIIGKRYVLIHSRTVRIWQGYKREDLTEHFLLCKKKGGLLQGKCNLDFLYLDQDWRKEWRDGFAIARSGKSLAELEIEWQETKKRLEQHERTSLWHYDEKSKRMKKEYEKIDEMVKNVRQEFCPFTAEQLENLSALFAEPLRRITPCE